MKKYMILVLLGLLVLSGLAAQAGRTLYVAVKSAQVKSSAGFFSSTLGNLPLGSAVTVIQENQKWAQVRSATQPAVTGWVSQASLSARRPASSGGSTGSGDLALAGKGFIFSAELEAVYRRDEKVSYDLIDRMEAQTVPDNELYQFLVEGRLARGE